MVEPIDQVIREALAEIGSETDRNTALDIESFTVVHQR